MAKNQIYAALDIGSSKIATLIAQKSIETGRISVIGASSIPSKGIKKGQIINLEEVSQAVVSSVEAAERMAGVGVEHMAVNISSVNINSMNSHGVVAVATPQGEVSRNDVMRVIEVAQAISLPNTQEVLHVLPTSYTLDTQSGIRDPIGMSGERLEVDTHIITASSILVRNITRCVAELGSQMDYLVFNGLASAYAVLTETEKELGVVLVDIGGGTTDIAMYVEGSLVYSAVLPVGAKNITSDLAIGFKVSLESAEKIKLFLSKVPERVVVPDDVDLPPTKKFTSRDKRKEEALDFSSLSLKEEVPAVSRKALVEGIIRPRVLEIFDLVVNHIEKSGYSHSVPSGLVLCGGGAMTVDILETVKRRVGLPVRIGEPTGLTGLIEDVSTPAFATTLGMLLFAVEQEYAGSSGKTGNGRNVFSGAGNFTNKVISMIKSMLP